jgi:hypothetical protein
MGKSFLAGLLFFSFTGCAGKLALSDREAAQQIQEYWHRNPWFKTALLIPLGRVTVLRDEGMFNLQKADHSKREITLSELKELKDWEDVGVLKVTVNEDLSKSFTNWNDWLALTQKGVQLRVVISEGTRGHELGCTPSQQAYASRSYGNSAGVCVPLGAYTGVKSIVKNELHSVGIDHYRVILGTSTWKRTSLSIKKDYPRAPKTENFDTNCKFIVALKHDPFTGKWNAVAQDVGDEGVDFYTHNVNKLIATQ